MITSVVRIYIISSGSLYLNTTLYRSIYASYRNMVLPGTPKNLTSQSCRVDFISLSPGSPCCICVYFTFLHFPPQLNACSVSSGCVGPIHFSPHCGFPTSSGCAIVLCLINSLPALTITFFVLVQNQEIQLYGIALITWCK